MTTIIICVCEFGSFCAIGAMVARRVSGSSFFLMRPSKNKCTYFSERNADYRAEKGSFSYEPLRHLSCVRQIRMLQVTKPSPDILFIILRNVPHGYPFSSAMAAGGDYAWLLRAHLRTKHHTVALYIAAWIK